jgi:mevalonate kinase
MFSYIFNYFYTSSIPQESLKMDIEISSDIPLAKGLGSSSSFAVSFSGCLLDYLSTLLA